MIARPATLTDSRAGDADADAAAAAAATATRVDGQGERYAVERELGRGGRGRVWLAHDRVMQRTIAIKQPAQRGDASDARFVREGLLTARLQHPAIVPVYDTGRWDDGAPYYTMKLVEGRTLRELIAAATSRAARIALLPHVVTVADAVAYAHDRGVIHRDLKPANVVCGGFGETVVVDWGLAKLASEPAVNGSAAAPVAAALTIEGAVLGTPAYMAPEQARGEPVDHRADIYALGAILYHLIAGEPPYDGASSDAVLASVVDGPPRPLSRSEAPVDLVAIVERAMAREPDRRYPSAHDLATDLRQFIAGRLVTAHDYSLPARLVRWAAQHRAVVSIAALALAVVAVVAVVAVGRVVDERDDAQAARTTADARAEALVLAQARAVIDRDPAAALAWLKTHALRTDVAQVRALAIDAASRGVARHVWRHRTEIGAIAVSRSSRLVATGGDDLAIRIWDAASGRGLARIATAAGVTGLAFTPDERALVATDRGGALHVHDLTTGTTRSIALGAGPLFALAIADDGRTIAAGGSAGAPVVIDRERGVPRTLPGRGARITSLALAPHGVVTGDAAGAVQLWSLDGSTPARVLGGHTGAVDDLVVDGGTAISAGDDAAVRRLPLGGAPGSSATYAAVALDVAIGPRSAIALACRDGRARIVIDGAARELLLPGAIGELSSVAWAPDGAHLAAGVLDGRVVVWDVASGVARELARHGVGPVHVAFAGDGALLAAGSDGAARLWPAEPPRGTLLALPQPAIYLAAAPSGAVALADTRGRLALVERGALRTLHEGDAVTAVAISDDGAQVWAASWDGAVRRWTAGATSVLDRGAGITWALARRGERFATAGAGGIRIWDRDGARTLDGHRGDVRSIALLPDGDRVLSGSSDRTVRLWTRAVPRTLASEADEVYLVAVSADGARAAAVTLTGLRLWSTADWTSRLLPVPAQIRSIAFAPDGTQLVATTAGAAIPVWDTRSGARRDLAGPPRGSNRLAFSPDGTRFATSGTDGAVRVWDAATGLERIAHRFAADAYDLAWTTAGLVVSSADRTLWIGAGTGPIVGADVASVRAELARTTAEIDAAGLATTDRP